MNYASFLLKSGTALAVLALLLLALEYLLPAALPFLAGALVAALLRRPACWLRQVTGMRYRPSAVAACLLFYSLFCMLAVNLGFLLFAQTVAFFTRLPGLAAELLPAAAGAWNNATAWLYRFLPGAQDYMSQLSGAVTAITGEALSQLSSGVLHGAAAFVRRLPNMVLGLFLGILSSFFILMDYDRIAAFVYRQLSPRLKRLLQSSKSFLVTTGRNVIKAYFLIMLMTFCEVSAGLWLLGVEYYAVLGIIVAAVDILPVLGSGGVLVPWGLWLVFSGNPVQGVGILLLYGIVTVVRTVTEPKILGDKIGLPPLVTILSMYLGLRLFGIGGLVLSPMVVTLLVHLNSKELLRLWKKEGER